jgi:hypothetical protein
VSLEKQAVDFLPIQARSLAGNSLCGFLSANNLKKSKGFLRKHFATSNPVRSAIKSAVQRTVDFFRRNIRLLGDIFDIRKSPVSPEL